MAGGAGAHIAAWTVARMTLPDGARVLGLVGGGDINEAFRVELADGRQAFVKTRPDAGADEYAAEAAGLRWLAEPGGVRTPEVLDVGADYLALVWIERGSLDAAGTDELGHGLARTHLAGAPCFGLPPNAGGDTTGTGSPDGESANARSVGGRTFGFGSLRLSNEPAVDWPTFYAERRLRPLAAIARERGALSRTGVEAVERVCDRLPDLCGPAEPPARLHGDLWSGNVMADADGHPWLIDPSAYGGHREVDLAMLRLFGAPSERVFAAYEESAPLADGWRERVELYQLLPLLVHAVLFGGSYGPAAERAALRYAR
ncbi:MAG TPA: fructosamine kinase family protein [Solirubrobacteraceae bacterium]|nr:fructosamine kinase family protein [Solirubrobacteraceae bacterium]